MCIYYFDFGEQIIYFCIIVIIEEIDIANFSIKEPLLLKRRSCSKEEKKEKLVKKDVCVILENHAYFQRNKMKIRKV